MRITQSCCRLAYVLLLASLTLALLTGCVRTVPDPEGSVLEPEGFVPEGEWVLDASQAYASDELAVIYVMFVLEKQPDPPQSSVAGCNLLVYDFNSRSIKGAIDLWAIDCVDESMPHCRISEDGSKIAVSKIGEEKEYCYSYKNGKLSRVSSLGEYKERDNLVLPYEYWDMIREETPIWSFEYPTAVFDGGIGYLALDAGDAEADETVKIRDYKNLKYIKKGEAYSIFS